jgi:hypothetical protein
MTSITGTTSTRIAAALSLVALLCLTVSDFVLTGFWDKNAMATSVLADILVLIVGVAVVNEFLAARSRRRWRLVADYSLVELASECRRVWVRLAETIGLGRRADFSREDFRALLMGAEDEDRLEQRAHEFACDADARRELQRVVGELVEAARDVLTSWAPVLIETPYSGALSRYVELQGLLGTLDVALWAEVRGDVPSYVGAGDPEWIGSRLATLIQLASEIELEFNAVSPMEIRAPTRPGREDVL